LFDISCICWYRTFGFGVFGAADLSCVKLGAARPLLGSCMGPALVGVASALLLWAKGFVRLLKGAFNIFPSMADCGSSSSLFAVVGRDTFVLCGAAGAVGALWKPGRYVRFEVDPA
jgi:hypothetical protein